MKIILCLIFTSMLFAADNSALMPGDEGYKKAKYLAGASLSNVLWDPKARIGIPFATTEVKSKFTKVKDDDGKTTHIDIELFRKKTSQLAISFCGEDELLEPIIPKEYPYLNIGIKLSDKADSSLIRMTTLEVNGAPGSSFIFEKLDKESVLNTEEFNIIKIPLEKFKKIKEYKNIKGLMFMLYKKSGKKDAGLSINRIYFSKD